MFTEQEKLYIAEQRDQNKSYKQIANALGSTKNKVKLYCNKHGLNGIRGKQYSVDAMEQEFKNRFEAMHTGFEYVSGYSGRNDMFVCRCRTCGTEQARTAQCAKPTYKSKLVCDTCAEKERVERERKEAEERATRVRKENEYTATTCAGCGETFLRHGNSQKYCSIECYKKAHGIGQEITKQCRTCGKQFQTFHDGRLYCSGKCARAKRIRKFRLSKDARLRKNGKIDYGISLDKLIKRDKNVCHICGEKCDKDDHVITDEGYFIAGERYPSIDHVLPIARGGRHVWSNVKLAHRGCNTAKRDKTVYEGRNGQMMLVI